MGDAMSKTEYQLVLGDKNYSSWSLRPWLLMRMLDIPFEEINIDIYNEGARERVLGHVPSAKVPALKAGGLTIWDTAAIIEYLAETHPGLSIWPEEKDPRAIARAVSAEMHSGFFDLRSEMPMDMNADKSGSPVSGAVAADVTRIVAIWRMCRSTYGQGGPFLFGAFSAADAMYAPVASRLRTYGVDLASYGDDGAASAYCQTVLSLAPVVEWMEQGRRQMDQRGRAY